MDMNVLIVCIAVVLCVLIVCCCVLAVFEKKYQKELSINKPRTLMDILGVQNNCKELDDGE